MGPTLLTFLELGGQLKHSRACKNVPLLQVQSVAASEFTGDVERA